MKRLGAFLLAFFVLILSIESSVGMHFCHDALVETSINKMLSSCCKENLAHDQPVLSKQCCEIAHFTLDFQDTLVTSADVTFSALIADIPVIQFELHALEYLSKQQFIFVEPPPESPHIAFYTLFEHYLI